MSTYAKICLVQLHETRITKGALDSDFPIIKLGVSIMADLSGRAA